MADGLSSRIRAWVVSSGGAAGSVAAVAQGARPGWTEDRWLAWPGTKVGGKHTALVAALCAAAALSGCAAPHARDFGGRWQPVNHFDIAPQAIPLQQSYEYFASPLDATLKTMLARWAKDTGMVLSYRWPDDYTLFTPVSDIHTSDLSAAVDQLAAIYASRGVSVAVRGREILVTPVPVPVPAASASAAAGMRSDDVPIPTASGTSL